MNSHTSFPKGIGRTLLNIVLVPFVVALALCVVLGPSADAEQMVSLPGGVPPQASELLAGAGPASSDMVLQMRIYLRLRNVDAARQMAEDQHNAASSYYHKWLNPQSFDQMFGPLQTSYDAIATWLRSQSFGVSAVRRDRWDVEFIGTVAQADQAFHVEIKTMSDGKHYGILTDPMIPASLQGSILGVLGLDNLSGVSPASTVFPVWTSANSKSPNGISYTAFAPADFYTFYDENALLSAGINGSISGIPNECMAIVGLSDYLSTAVNLFASQFGLSPPAITTEYATTDSSCNPNPCDPHFTADEDEADLDLEWGHAAAQGAPLIFYVGDRQVETTGVALLDALNLAKSDDTCGTISVSFRQCDLSGCGYFE